MLRVKVYYNLKSKDEYRVWMYVGQTNEISTFPVGPSLYSARDFERMQSILTEATWESLDAPVEMRD